MALGSAPGSWLMGQEPGALRETSNPYSPTDASVGAEIASRLIARVGVPTVATCGQNE